MHHHNGIAAVSHTIPLHTLNAKSKFGMDELPFIKLTPGGKTQGPDEVGPVFADPKVVAALMEKHRPVCVGETLLAAQHLAELVEETAHIAFLKETLTKK